MADVLVEIPSSEWPELLKLYRRDWPSFFTGYSTIDTFMRWQKQQNGPINHLVFYSLNGDWRQDGTYVCIHRYQLFPYTLDPSSDRLQRALALLNWPHSYVVSALGSRFWPAVMSVMDSQRYTLEFDDATNLFYLPKEQAVQLEISCPPGIKLAALRKEHAYTINNLWPNKHQGSLFYIEQMIELNPTVGAFDENGELVAWCLRWQAGTHGALQVKPSHLRRGLGSLVCRALTRKLGEMGLDSAASVNFGNDASYRLFEKLGFQVIDQVNCTRNNATEPVEWID